MRSAVIGSILVLTLAACGGGNNDTKRPDFVSALAAEDSIALFRGHHMGDMPDEVRQHEVWQPVVDTDTLMQFGHEIQRDTAVIEVVAYYAFDTFGLFEMQFDIHPPDGPTTEAVARELHRYLDHRFGESDRLGMSRRWTTVSQANQRVEVLLTDESADYGQPFLSLNFLELLDDEI